MGGLTLWWGDLSHCNSSLIFAIGPVFVGVSHCWCVGEVYPFEWVVSLWIEFPMIWVKVQSIKSSPQVDSPREWLTTLSDLVMITRWGFYLDNISVKLILSRKRLYCFYQTILMTSYEMSIINEQMIFVEFLFQSSRWLIMFCVLCQKNLYKVVTCHEESWWIFLFVFNLRGDWMNFLYFCHEYK